MILPSGVQHRYGASQTQLWNIYRVYFSGEKAPLYARKFVKETGYAPMEYFIRQEMNSACMYLIKTDLKINQIAQRLGFHDAYYFTRMFTKIVGLSPSKPG